MAKKMNKKAQATIWIIVGVILVASVTVFFIIEKGAEIIQPPASSEIFDMQSFLDECTTQYVEEVVELILPQGGFVEPRNYKVFNEQKIEYLCENIGYYESCVQQHPVLLQEIKREIENYLNDGRIEDCFREMQTEFSRRGNLRYTGGFSPEATVDWGPDKIIVEIEQGTIVEKQGESRRFNNFAVEVKSPAYNLASIAIAITDQEARYCYFEYVGYSSVYPYRVKLYSASDQTKIYAIKDNKSGKEMYIAIRSCALPAGLP